MQRYRPLCSCTCIDTPQVLKQRNFHANIRSAALADRPQLVLYIRLCFTFYIYPFACKICCQDSLPSSLQVRPVDLYPQQGHSGTKLSRELCAAKKSGLKNRFTLYNSVLPVK